MSFGPGNGLSMDAKKSQVLMEIFDLGACPHHVDEQLAVPAGPVARIESAYGFKSRPPEKRRLLQPGGAPVKVTLQGETGSPNASNSPALGIDDKPIPHHDIAIGIQ